MGDIEAVLRFRLAEVHGEGSDVAAVRDQAAGARGAREELMAEMSAEEVADARERIQLLLPGDTAIP